MRYRQLCKLVELGLASDVHYAYHHEHKQLARTIAFRLNNIPVRVTINCTHLGPVGNTVVLLSAKRLRKALMCYEIGDPE